MSYNRVVLVGNCVADPELRYVPSGKAKCKFKLAVNDKFQKDKTLFIAVEMWEKTAEIACEHLKKGTEVLVEGRLTEDTWTGQDGTPKSQMLVKCDNFSFLRNGKKAENVVAPPDVEPAPAPNVAENDEVGVSVGVDVPF